MAISNIDNLLTHFGRTYKSGDLVFSEGDPGNEFYLIHQGAVRCYKVIKDKERTLQIMKKDDFFGEVAALTGTVRTATAVATQPTVLIAIPVPVMEKIIEHQPEVSIKLLKKMAVRLKASTDMVVILMEGDPQVRTILGIIRLLETEGMEREEGIVFPFDMQEFANQIQVEPAQVGKVIEELTGKGIIETSAAGLVTVRNPEDLGEYYRFLELARKFGKKQ